MGVNGIAVVMGATCVQVIHLASQVASLLLASYGPAANSLHRVALGGVGVASGAGADASVTEVFNSY